MEVTCATFLRPLESDLQTNDVKSYKKVEKWRLFFYRQKPQDGTSVPRSHPIRVAVIEDSSHFLAATLEALRTLPELALAGTAANPGDAIALLNCERPDFLILDMFLERGTGIEVLKYLQAQAVQGNPRRIAVVVVTGMPSSQLESHCLALGAAALRDKAEGFDWIPEFVKRLSAEY